jgi:malate synthase
MEDAATAEISRTQIWHWAHHPRGMLDDGRKVTLDLFRTVESQELDKIRESVGNTRFETGHYETAARLLSEIITADELAEFLTLKAYEHID